MDQRAVDPAPRTRRPHRAAATVHRGRARGRPHRADAVRRGGPRPAARSSRSACRRSARSATSSGFLWVDEVPLDPAVLVPKRWDAATTPRGARGRARRRSPRTSRSPSRPTSSNRRFGRWPRNGAGRPGDLFMAIRVAVTGRTATPPLFDTLVALGRDRVLARLDRALEALPGVVTGLRGARRIGLIVARRPRRPGRSRSSGRAILPDGWSQAANAISPWLLVAFLLGSTMPDDRWAAAAGVGTLLLALVGYYAMVELRYGYGAGTGALIFWGAGAAIGGPVFGVAGHWWRTSASHRRRAAAIGLLAAVVHRRGAVPRPDPARPGRGCRVRRRRGGRPARVRAVARRPARRVRRDRAGAAPGRARLHRVPVAVRA